MSNPVGVRQLKFSAIGATKTLTITDNQGNTIQPSNVTIVLEGGQGVVSASPSGSNVILTAAANGGMERIWFKYTVNNVQYQDYVDCFVEVNQSQFYVTG